MRRTALEGELLLMKVWLDRRGLPIPAGILGANFIVPNLSTRRLDTTVEIYDGQTLALAGLLRPVLALLGGFIVPVIFIVIGLFLLPPAGSHSIREATKHDDQ